MDRNAASRFIIEDLGSPQGLTVVFIGLSALLSTCLVDSHPLHVAAAAVFAVGIPAAHFLGRVDLRWIRPPLAGTVRSVVDALALAFLLAATFVPFTVIVILGDDLLNVPSLIGAVAVLALTLDRAVYFRQRLASMAFRVAVGWFSVVLFKSHLAEMPVHVVTIYLALVAVYTVVTMLGALRLLPVWCRSNAVLVTLGVSLQAPVIHVVVEHLEAL